MKTFAAYYDNEIRMKSSSGGIFSLLATKFDVIYGVTLSKDCYSAEFTRVDDGNISSLRGSKYFQAYVGNAFKHVKEDLIQGKKVLFSGTGCQINGLKHYLRNDYINLVTVDVICHGVPSQKLWSKYVKYQEYKYGKIINVDFRCKNDSWHNFGIKENQLYISKDDDTFMRFFLRNYCLRPSCYRCIAKQYKESDISIADFWGIEEICPEMNDGKGTSLVITRTKKGEMLFDSIKKSIKYKEVKYEDGVKYNDSEYKSVYRPNQRDTFYVDLNSMTFLEIEKKYAYDIRIPLIIKAKKYIKKLIFAMGWGSLKTNNNYGILYSFNKIRTKE